MTLERALWEVERLASQLPGEAGLFGDDIYRTTLLNEGSQQFVRDALCLRDRYRFNTKIGEHRYNMLDKFPRFLDVDHEGAVRVDGDTIRQTTQARKNRDAGEWQDAGKGTPSEYYLRDRQWFELTPAPDAVVVVEIPAFCYPEPVDALEDPLLNGHPMLEPYAMGPVYWAVGQLSMKDDKTFTRMMEFYQANVNKVKRQAHPDAVTAKRIRPLVYNSMRGTK